MTTYVVATTQVPKIICPPWCTISAQQHLADLGNWEGRCLHNGTFTFPIGSAPHVGTMHRPPELTICRTLFPDGTADPNETDDPSTADGGTEPYLMIDQHDLTIDEAIAYGQWVIERAMAAREGRA